MAEWRRRGKHQRRLIVFLLPLVSLLFFWVLASIYVAYRIMHPEKEAQGIDPSAFLLPFQEFRWKGQGGVELNGWFISAKPTAPVIFLCHGYGSYRAKTLGLAERLHAAGLSSAVIGLRGHEGSQKGGSTLGWLEGQDLVLARDQLRMDKLIGDQKLGAWGVNIGAYAALEAASEDTDFRAVAADMPALSVADFLRDQFTQFVGGDYGMLQYGTRWVFSRAVGGWWPGELPQVPPHKFGRQQILFLISEAQPERSRRLEGFLRSIPSLAERLTLPLTRADDLNGPALEAYDRKVAAFFKGVQW